MYHLGPQKRNFEIETHHPTLPHYVRRACATMTVEEAHPQTKYNGLVPESQPSTQQPTLDLAPARFRPLSVTDTMPTIDARSSNTASIRSNKTLAAQTKVAIPRQRAPSAPRYNRRVPRACASCRQRKTKCSGDTPVCRQCRELRATCNYPEGWRERTKKYVDLWLYMRISFWRNLQSRASMLTVRALQTS